MRKYRKNWLQNGYIAYDACVTTLLSLDDTITLSLKRNKFRKEKKMKISTILQKVVKKEGKHSITSKTITKLKDSKEFSYLVDPTRA